MREKGEILVCILKNVFLKVIVCMHPGQLICRQQSVKKLVLSQMHLLSLGGNPKTKPCPQQKRLERDCLSKYKKTSCVSIRFIVTELIPRKPSLSTLTTSCNGYITS